MTQKFRIFLLTSAIFSLSITSVYAKEADNPVDLQSDSLMHDETGQIITAAGDVILKQNGRTVKADEIVYNLRADTVVAKGNVEFIDANGDKHLAEAAEFNNSLKDGFVQGLQSFLIDGSRFKASNGRHVEGEKTVMKDAFYTPCKPCKDHPERDPLWQIRASKVVHDKSKQQISYKNARFEIKGVPVAYIPYFVHPDGSVKRKSGFLAPSLGFKSASGGFAQGNYYWSIAPDKDVTFGLRAMTRQAPMALAQWRQRWENASFIANGSVTYSSRRDSTAGALVVQDDELRGSLSANGLWDMNNKWRSGVVIDVVSDDQYRREYDFDSRYVLKNEVYAERFSGRNYASGRLIAFQDLRVEENRQDQPQVLPEVEANFIGEPDSIPIIGGRWSADFSMLGLVRDNSEQDMNRFHTNLGWKRRLVSDYGFVSIVDANVQASLYSINDRTGSATNSAISANSIESRGFGYVNLETSYPIIKKFEGAQMLIEPKISATISPNIDIDGNIPNEDSLDTNIDALNLFEANRFPGVDGIEDRNHVTYGVKSGLYGDDGSYGSLFVGQSYRFNNDDNPFTQGSGLNEQTSDVVGQISASYKDNYKLNYSFQLDGRNLSSQGHEIDASMSIKGFDLSTRYLFAKALGGTDISETREQISNSASYYINDKWRVFGSAQHDLGVDAGLRRAQFGVDYIGDCVSLSMIGQRNLTSKTTGNSATEIMFRIGFKNLGSFETSKVSVGNNYN